MVKDHLGHTFIGVREMYLFWGLTEWVYYERKGKGWPLEKILTTPIKVQCNNNLDDSLAYTKREKRTVEANREKREYRLISKTTHEIEGGTVTVTEYQRG